MEKNIFAITSIITTLATFYLARVVDVSGAKTRVNRLYCLWACCVGLWSLFLALSVYSTDYVMALWHCRFLHVWAIILPAVYVHFVLCYLNEATLKSRFILSLYAIAAFMIILDLTPYFIDVEYQAAFGFYVTKPQPLYAIHIFVFISSVFYVYYQLVKSLLKSNDKSRSQHITYFFVATLIGYAGGLTNYLINYGYKIPILYPFGNCTILIYLVIIGIGIVKHRIMDVQVIVRRATVFTGLFAFVYGTYSLFTILGQKFFANAFAGNAWLSMIPTVMIITFSMRPLENFMVNITDKFLFQKKYDYKELLRMFTSEVLTILDLSQLTQKTIDGLDTIIKLESCGIFLQNSETNKYELQANIGIEDSEIELSESDAIVFYLNMSQKCLLRDTKKGSLNEIATMNSDFDHLRAELCVPIIFRSDLVGFLSLGKKKSGDPYNQEDLEVLMSLARTEAIAISNARLFSELSKTQAEAAQREKMAVIGTLAAGINHEICNPLGIARGQCEMFLLNYRDGLYKEKTESELVEKLVTILNKVINEIDRATGITKRLSTFAKPPKKFAMGEVNVKNQVDEVFAILGHELKVENINFSIEIPEKLPNIYADKRQIQEVIFNIVRNGAQAIEKKGDINISAFQSNGNVILEIADTGSGIPPEKINDIFNPFFTTKDPGKGTGLGLFIVKQIVERNKGTIHVESVLGQGTKFTLEFQTADEGLGAQPNVT